MSLHPQPLEPVPEDTARVARAAFPRGNPYLTLRDQLGVIFQDEDFTALFPMCGQPSLPPWRLALITILQFRANSCLTAKRRKRSARGLIGSTSLAWS
jgi:transposase